MLFRSAAAQFGSNSTGQAIDVENNSVTITLREEPPQLDQGRSTDASSFVVLAHAFEGLIAYDEEARLTPGVAERWGFGQTARRSGYARMRCGVTVCQLRRMILNLPGVE